VDLSTHDYMLEKLAAAAVCDAETRAARRRRGPADHRPTLEERSMTTKTRDAIHAFIAAWNAHST